MFVFSQLIFTGCDDRQIVEESDILVGEVITIKPFEQFIPYDILPILDSVKFVQLELTEDSFIGEISKVVVFEDQIYIFDKLSYSLFVFDLNGNYIFKIANFGRGPGEYIQIDYFDIDFQKKQIVLTDLMSYSVLRYDLNGDFISQQKIPFWIEAITPTFDGGFALYSNYRRNLDTFKKEYNLLLLDSMMHITDAWFSYNSSNFINPVIKFPLSGSGTFYTYNNEPYFFSPLKRTVYQITREGLKRVYYFEGAFFDKTYLNRKDELKKYLETGDFFSFYSIHETDRYLISNLKKFPSIHTCLYSKDSGNTICSAIFTAGAINFPVLISATYDDWMISIIHPDYLLNWRKNMEFNNSVSENNFARLKQETANLITLNDNPLLMFYRLKQF
ncbi:MAG: 6-bladed beta-propeller [Bacteroidales bacterium]|nr:6-bladed beta-propeller [Bacteroidales bacterium]